MPEIKSTNTIPLDTKPRRTTHIRYQHFGWLSTTRPIAAPGSGWVPAIDLYETLDECIIEVSLGGVSVNDVQVRVDGRIVVISGIRPEHAESGIRCYHILEIERGNFERILELPSDVDPDTLKATSGDGLLIIRATKRSGGTLPGCFPADSMEGLE